MQRFYQQLVGGIVNYESFGRKLIAEIKAAHAFRQVDRVKELSRFLLNIPIKEYQLIGQYYLAWCHCRELKYNNGILEQVIEESHTYKAKAIISRAAFDFYKANYKSALFFYFESFKANPTVSDYLLSAKAITVIKSIEGFHSSALKDMERLLPLIRYAEPFVCYDFLNSYAVQLGEAGYKQEARNIISDVLKSPFAFAYPEWQETADELKGTNRSFAVIDSSPRLPRNVLLMPVVKRDRVEFPAWVGQPAKVFDYEHWKKKMAKGKKRNGDKKKPVEEMDEKDMFFEIMGIYSSPETTDEQRRKIFDAVMKVMSEPDKPEPDNDEGA